MIAAPSNGTNVALAGEKGEIGTEIVAAPALIGAADDVTCDRSKHTLYHLLGSFIMVKTGWKCLYQAVDNAAQTADFYLSEHRNVLASKAFFFWTLATD